MKSESKCISEVRCYSYSAPDDWQHLYLIMCFHSGMHVLDFAYFFRKWIDIMLDLKLHGCGVVLWCCRVVESEYAEEFFLDPQLF